MAVNAPHFDLPFTFGSGTHAKVVEQGLPKDVENCVTAAIRTVRGTRYYVPQFGVSDPIFRNMPVSIKILGDEIKSSEPRAILSFDAWVPGEDVLAENIVVGVTSGY